MENSFKLNEMLLQRLRHNDPSLVELKLNMHSPRLTDEDIQKLVEALKSNTFLKSLNVSSNIIGAEGAKALAKNQTITSLDVGHNQIGAEGAKALAQNKTLTCLNVSLNMVGAEGAKALARNQTITRLDVSHNQIGAEGAKALAQNKTLTCLNVSLNMVGAEGAKALAENKTITELNISDFNKIGDEGAKALAQNKTLTMLDVCNYNEISNEGAKALAQNQTLTTLNVSHNKIEYEGINTLIQKLIQNKTLTKLSIKDNKINNKNLKEFKSILEINNLLRSTDLGPRNIGLVMRDVPTISVSEYLASFKKNTISQNLPKNNSSNLIKNQNSAIAKVVPKTKNSSNGFEIIEDNAKKNQENNELFLQTNLQNKQEQVEKEMEEMSDIDEESLSPNKKYPAAKNKKPMSEDEKNNIGSLGEKRAFEYYFNKYKEKYGKEPEIISEGDIKGFKIVGTNKKNQKKETTYVWKNAAQNTTAPIDAIITTKRNGENEGNKYVEIKGTKEKCESEVTFTRNQLKVMKQYRNKFILFRAYDVYDKNIENRNKDREIKDPYKNILLEPKLAKVISSIKVKI